MSIALMTVVWERPDLDPYERLVMLALADHAGDDGTCYPSIARLCARTGMKERGVQTVLKRLAARGLVKVVPNAGRHGANVYVIPSTPAPDAPPAHDAPRTGCTPHHTHPASHVVNPRTPCGGTPAPDAPEPSFNHQEPSLGPRARSARRKPEMPLPENWCPSDRNITDAMDRGFSQQEIDREALQFRDHHLARDTRFRDWEAAWRTWLGNARKFSNGRVALAAVPGGGGRGGSLASIAAQRRARDAY